MYRKCHFFSRDIYPNIVEGAAINEVNKSSKSRWRRLSRRRHRVSNFTRRPKIGIERARDKILFRVKGHVQMSRDMHGIRGCKSRLAAGEHATAGSEERKLGARTCYFFVCTICLSHVQRVRARAYGAEVMEHELHECTACPQVHRSTVRVQRTLQAIRRQSTLLTRAQCAFDPIADTPGSVNVE